MIVGAHSFPVTGDGEHNFSTICAAAERAAEAGAELLLFPECALTGYPPRDIPFSAAVDFPRLAEMHAALHKLSDARNLALIVGSMVPAENGVRNAVMIFRPGEEPLIYAKRALWGWDRDNFVPGDAPGVFSFRGWKIGVRICYEVRFPEYFRELYRARCDLALTPFYDVTDAPSPDRYDLLRGHLRTRAVENVFSVLSANAIAPYPGAPTMLCDASGRILVENPPDAPYLLLFDLSKHEPDFGERGRIELSDSLVR